MIERGPATEDAMICEFLRAEIESSRYSGDVKAGLARLGLNRSLVDVPNLADPSENWSRRRLLDYRGYHARQGLFTKFPLDVSWLFVGLESSDFHSMQYIKDTVTKTPNWTELSDGTRLVSVGARNLSRYSSDPRFQHVLAIVQAVREGKSLPPLIAARHHQGHLVLIEGLSRATAYAAEGFTERVTAYVGSSPSMRTWAFY